MFPKSLRFGAQPVPEVTPEPAVVLSVLLRTFRRKPRVAVVCSASKTIIILAIACILVLFLTLSHVLQGHLKSSSISNIEFHTTKMFDISWSDPGSEKVGERKARKEREQEVRDAQSSSQGSRRTSSLTTSTSRSSSSADQSVFSGSSRNGASSAKSGNLFGFAMKKKRISAKGKSKLATELQIPSHTISPSLPTASTARSTVSSTDFALNDKSPTAAVPKKGKYLIERVESSDPDARNGSKSGKLPRRL